MSTPPKVNDPRKPPHERPRTFDESKTTVDGNPFAGIAPSDLETAPQNVSTSKAVAATARSVEPKEPTAPSPRSTQPFDRDGRAKPSPFADATKLEGLIAQLEKTVRESMSSFDAAKATVDKVQESRQELLEDAKRVNDDYRKLANKLSGERDALANELAAQRSQHAAETKKQSQTFTDLQRDLERERQENGRKLQDALHTATQAQKKVDELNVQLREALDSRDRIAERVRRVEENLEHTVLPLREELDTIRAREAKLQAELVSARKEVQALKLLARPPSRY